MWTKSYLIEIPTFYQCSYSTSFFPGKGKFFLFNSFLFGLISLLKYRSHHIIKKNKTQNINSSVNRWFHFPRCYNWVINSMMSYILFRTLGVLVCFIKTFLLQWFRYGSATQNYFASVVHSCWKTSGIMLLYCILLVTFLVFYA